MNTSSLFSEIDRAITEARTSGDQFATMIIDIDGFDLVNLEFGYQTGDAVLAGVKQRIENCIRDTDVVKRWQEDSFVAVLYGSPTLVDVELIRRRLAECVSAPHIIGENIIYVRVTVGVVNFVVSPESTKACLTISEHALNRAKRRGWSGFHYEEILDPRAAA